MTVRLSQRELARFQLAVHSMNYKSNVYRMLKHELTLKGYWRNLPRGIAGFKRLRENELE